MAVQKDIWQSRYYAIPRKYMSLMGIWPYQTVRDRYLRFVPAFIFTFSIALPEGLYVLIGSDDYVENIFNGMPSTLVSVFLSCELMNMMINIEKIGNCLAMIEEDWRSLNTDINESILRRYTEYGRHLNMFYSVFMQSSIFLYTLKPLMTLMESNTSNITESTFDTTKLPFHVEYGEKLDQHFYLIMCHCYLTVFYHMFIVIGFNAFYCTLIQHACGMFSIVGYMLENIGKDNDANSHLKLDKINDNDYNKALDCLRKHLRVIKFSKLIESIFTSALLVSVNCNVIIGSIYGIQMLMNLDNWINLIPPLCMYLMQFLHLFLLFWQAQFLLDYSYVPYNSICKTRWYYTSERCRKIFLLIMSRTISPCKITAGKIITLSIESYGAVLKTSMSYFMVLSSFQ